MHDCPKRGQPGAGYFATAAEVADRGIALPQGWAHDVNPHTRHVIRKQHVHRGAGVAHGAGYRRRFGAYDDHDDHDEDDDIAGRYQMRGDDDEIDHWMPRRAAPGWGAGVALGIVAAANAGAGVALGVVAANAGAGVAHDDDAGIDPRDLAAIQEMLERDL